MYTSRSIDGSDSWSNGRAVRRIHTSTGLLLGRIVKAAAQLPWRDTSGTVSASGSLMKNLPTSVFPGRFSSTSKWMLSTRCSVVVLAPES